MKSGLFKYKLDEAQLASLRRQFDLLATGGSVPANAVRKDHRTLQGCFRHLLRVLRSNEADELFSIYIGKTRSLANRAQNYLSGFQPHSPNDFKLRIFQAVYVSEAAPGAALDLLFSRRNVEQLTASENDAIRLFNPILNKLQPATPDAKLNLQNVFAEYYRSAFERSLQDGD